MHLWRNFARKVRHATSGTAASIAMTASRFSSILGFERSVDCALRRDHCRQFVVGLI
jgi:hypothetical protein